MARPMVPSQQKLAEKLTILYDRGLGMLIRIYNIKKMLATADSKPTYLNDKNLEPVIRSLVKKFPTIETKSSTILNAIKPIAGDIHKMLSLYYFTFVDIMDFKDNVTNLLTTIDACQVHFDLSLNYDLTKGYLDLISVYLAVMILLSRVEDRKAVLGLFVLAGDIVYNKIEDSFHRLGQMIVEYENPIKKLSEEFIPHAKSVTEAVLSVSPIYMRHCTTAEQWRANQTLSLLSDSAKILTVATSDTIQCEYLSMDVLEKWIYFGTMLCHQQILGVPEGLAMWKQVLLGSYVSSLCRDEVIHIHSVAAEFFDSIKGYGKKVSEIKQWHTEAVEKAPTLHRERRKYLRTALKELALVFADQPGLLGPKALNVFMGLSLARDEFLWLLRHHDNPPLKGKSGKQLEEFFTDRQIPELMFHIEELRALVKRYSQVLQRYYIQFLCGQDTTNISQQIQSLSTCPEDESILLSSFCNAIASLSVKQVEAGELFDFRGLRLDWFRLQTYSSLTRSGLELQKYPALARHMNTVIFHTKMVDSLDQVLAETSDLSLYCFHTSLLEKQFKQCLEFPAQHRYIIAYPMICAHFMTATHELCPEERHSIGTTSIQYGHWFLKEISEEVNQVITTICEEHCLLADKLLPKNCAAQIALSMQQRRKDKKGHPVEEPEKPGAESYRKHREDLTRLDKLHMALTELCYAINYCSVITIWEHGFVPREFFTSTLEARLNKALVGMAMFNPERGEIAKPSELFNGVRTVMSVIQGLESYVNVDMSRVFNNVLPQQTQPNDSFSGDKTLTTIYTSWYLDVMLRRASEGHIIYSPSQKAFINITTDPQVQFNAEEYADLSELRALAELIGPYGMKYLGERVMWHVACQVEELRKVIWQYRDILRDMRTNFDKPEFMKEAQKKLLCADSVLQRMTIVGVLLSFRSLAQEALLDVLNNHIPFLMSSIVDFQQHLPNGQDSMLASIRSQVVNEMATAAGLPSDIDPALCAAIRAMKLDGSEEAYDVTCLLMVCVAVSLPRLARLEGSFYKALLQAHLNNIHCLGKAINALAGALFMIHGRNDIEDRLREFLALASSSLLKLGQEVDKEAIKNRESVFILLDVIVQESPFLTMDLLESCFPYALLRTAYHTVYKYNSEAS